MFKKCKVVMLPTNEKAKVGADNWYLPKTKTLIINNIVSHLYITSDEEIKEGDWFIIELFKVDGTSDGLHVEQATFIEDVWINKGIIARRHSGNCKKVIATTDRLTIDIGIDSWIIPQPSQSFIEEYVQEYNKGNIITDVMIEYSYKGEQHNEDSTLNTFHPKVNPKDNTITIKKVKDSWTREEVIELLHKKDLYGNCNTDEEFANWIDENI